MLKDLASTHTHTNSKGNVSSGAGGGGAGRGLTTRRSHARQGAVADRPHAHTPTVAQVVPDWDKVAELMLDKGFERTSTSCSSHFRKLNA